MRKIAKIRILGTHVTREAVVHRVLAYAPAAVWAGVLLFLGGRRNVPSVESPLPLDKAAHFLLYGLLGVLVTVGWRRARQWPALLYPVLLALAVGAADELHQRTVSGRSSELADWIADAAGILAGVWIMRYGNRHRI